jgi:hypothetical protein
VRRSSGVSAIGRKRTKQPNASCRVRFVFFKKEKINKAEPSAPASTGAVLVIFNRVLSVWIIREKIRTCSFRSTNHRFTGGNEPFFTEQSDVRMGTVKPVKAAAVT